MRLYRTSNGEWAGKQSAAARLVRENGGSWEQVDVPTDKAGLISWLNERRGEVVPMQAASEPAPTVADGQRTKSAWMISTEEEIQSCDLPRLAVLAENVAWRFHELARASRCDPS